jgi:hypothetical protein
MQLNNQVRATKLAQLWCEEILCAPDGAACGGTNEKRRQISYLTASF